VLHRTSSSKFSSSNILNLKNMRARSTAGVSIHPGKAAAAASTAALTCSAVHIGVSAIISPVDGLKTGERATEFTFSHSPPMKSGQGVRLVGLTTCIRLKSETRKSKSETNPNTEIRKNEHTRKNRFWFGIRACFGFRHSNFEFSSRVGRNGFHLTTA